jgi:HSP20 family molecular chaperone IbpA
MKFGELSQSQAESTSTTLRPSDPAKVQWEAQQVQLAIARRAYELFEARGRKHGHDWEDWLRAESELLRPVSVAIAQSRDRIRVHANVLGFADNELRVSIEPRRITILGKKDVSAPEIEGSKNVYVDLYPDTILHSIELACEVVPEAARIQLQGGILQFELPKAVKHATRTQLKVA